ncbi:MAG: HNH endonuclease [Acidimicrobiales bacterium]
MTSDARLPGEDGSGNGSSTECGLEQILDRDGPTCVWCGRRFVGLVRPTTEHLVPRLKGGPSWLENEVAACRRCNGQRGHRSLGDWADECERRGWLVDRSRLVRTLEGLTEAIARRGGQRRARPWLAAQLRRLDR